MGLSEKFRIWSEMHFSLQNEMGVADVKCEKNIKFLLKGVLCVQLFSLFLLSFSFLELSDFFIELSRFFINLSHFFKRVSEKKQKLSYYADNHRLSKLAQNSRIFDQIFFLSEFLNLRGVVVKKFQKCWQKTRDDYVMGIAKALYI